MPFIVQQRVSLGVQRNTNQPILIQQYRKSIGSTLTS